MSAPSSSKMSKDAQMYYGQSLGAEGEEYVDVLFENVVKGWKSWEGSITWGGLTVNGSGIGAWSGSGSGGQIEGAAYSLPDFIFKGNAPEQVKFAKGLGKALTQKFAAFVSSYKFQGVNYVGTSAATDKNPGPVDASNASTPLSGAGSGTNPSGIADLWKTFLPPPDFDFTNPQGKSDDLIKAIAKTIEQSFRTVWLAATMIQGNTVKTNGLPNGVVTGFTTPNNGKLM